MPSTVELDGNEDPLVGQTLEGKYTLERLIGRGGMGHVYLASTADDSRDVVVKTIAPPLAQQPQAMARFEREAKRLDGLRHSNIVEMFGYGRHGGRAYIVMEFVDGELLTDYMARKGRLTMAEFVPIAAQILKGVGHAHSRDLMIRDIKPANVMLCVRKGRANFVKIIDFGLAKMLEGDEDITKQHFIGTSGYLSPEQIKGLDIDLRVDVYALGVLFYQLLSGRMPFEAENDTTLLYKHVHDYPTPLSEVLPSDHEVPEELVHLIHDCLEKAPDDRPRDANEIVEKLIDCVPMSMFKLPPASSADTEQSTISALSTAALAAPTGETATYLQREKLGEANDAELGAEAGAALSASGSSVTREHVVVPADRTEPQKSKLGLIIGGLVAVAVAAVVGAIVFATGTKEEAPSNDAPAATTVDVGKLEASLGEAQALIDEGNFDAATDKVDAVRPKLGEAPELEAKVQRLDEAIEVGKLLATARKLDEDGRTDAAISAYKDVLAADAANAEARARVAELEASIGSEVEAGDKLPSEVEPEKLPSEDKKKKSTKKRTTSKPADPKADTTKKPPKKDEKDNPFLPTKKGGKSGPFLPTEN